jgi:hypothetical protein
MRLIDLKPEWDSRKKIFLRFDCPKCRLNGFKGNVSRLDIPVKEIEPGDRPMWNMTGKTFEDLTLTPSIRFQHHTGKKPGADCDAHFFITNGNINFV